MKTKGPSKRAVIRYALFQIPELIILFFALIFLRKWVDLPAWAEWTIIAAWIGKGVIMFLFVWRAYDHRSIHSMIGAQGIAEEKLAPFGHVRVRGELWKAEVMKGIPEIPKGKSVQVCEIRGLTLIVQPDTP